MKILELENITKKYGGVVALSNINISFKKGILHSIVGENGAGKSTLVNIITGAVSPTSGVIKFDNDTVEMSPVISKKMGILPIYQELNLIEELKVYENIFYGNEISKKGLLDKFEMKRASNEILTKLGVNLNVEEKIKDLGIGNKQIVELAKVLVNKPRIILFDEPTATLTNKEIDTLHNIMFNLIEQGISIIYVSHKLDEVLKISDKISIFRDGQLITSIEKNDTDFWNIDYVVENILGRDFSVRKDEKDISNKSTALELINISNKNISNINFKSNFGEVTSFYGLLGSGRTELLNVIFGIDEYIGDIFVNGKNIDIKSPIIAIENKIGYITEDRKDSGLFLDLSIKDNIAITTIEKFAKSTLIDNSKLEEEITQLLLNLDVRYSSLNQKVKELSGGNQQKVLIAKWLVLNPDILIFDEPTRGVDIGAKEEIYKIINDLANSGKAIIVVSSDVEEIVRLSDVVHVMRNGKIVSQYMKNDLLCEKLISDSVGGLDVE